MSTATLTKKIAPKKAAVKREPPKPKWTYVADAYNGIEFLENGEPNVLSTFELSYSQMDCSCGLQEADGISELEGYLGKVPREVVKKALDEYLDAIKKSQRVAFVILSNNKDTPKVNLILDELVAEKKGSSMTDWRKNPNSGKLIRVWVI